MPLDEELSTDRTATAEWLAHEIEEEASAKTAEAEGDAPSTSQLSSTKRTSHISLCCDWHAAVASPSTSDASRQMATLSAGPSSCTSSMLPPRTMLSMGNRLAAVTLLQAHSRRMLVELRLERAYLLRHVYIV